VTAGLSVDVDGAIDWLQHLYGHAEAGWVNLWSFQGRSISVWAPVDELDRLRPQIERLGERGDLYFGVALRRQRCPDGRGRKADCLCIPGLWVDLDWLSEVHHTPNLPASREQAIELARSFPLKPSAVADTGWGLQVWWLFAEPLPALEAEPLLARWKATWQKLAGRLHIDPVWNIDRVMRLPGSFNMKRNPITVTLKADYLRVYQPSDFDERLEPEPTVVVHERQPTGHLASADFNEHVTAEQVFATQSTWRTVRVDRNGDQHWHHDGSSNEISATTYGDDGFTCVWSETVASLTGCETRKPMTPWALYTFLLHRGDFKASYQDILDRGFKALELPREPPPPVVAIQVLRPRLRASSTYGLKEIEWMWKPYIPSGKLTFICGQPAVGKSTLALDLAARVSRGAPMPDGWGGGQPANVILLSAEDDPEDTASWRLEAAGADRDRILHFTGVEAAGELLTFTVPAHISVLHQAVTETGARLVVVDVLMAYMDERVDVNADSKVRRALESLRVLAAATGVAVVCLRHPRKGGGSANEAGGGSIAFSALFRSELHVGFHPEEEGLRVLAPGKNNLARKPRALTFQLMPAELNADYARIEWGEACDVSADQLTDPSLAPREDGPAVAEARQLIRELLKPGVEMWSKDFVDALTSYGVSKETIKRARTRERVQAFQVTKIEEGKSGWKVWLPQIITNHPERSDNPDEPF
jgi:hypothetical protein